MNNQFVLLIVVVANTILSGCINPIDNSENSTGSIQEVKQNVTIMSFDHKEVYFVSGNIYGQIYVPKYYYVVRFEDKHTEIMSFYDTQIVNSTVIISR